MGKNDVTFLRPGERSTGPFIIVGDKLSVAIHGAEPPAAKAAEGEGATPATAWPGALMMGQTGESMVVVNATPALELNGDFAIEMWVRPSSVGGGAPAYQALFSRALVGLDDIVVDGVEVHQLLLRMSREGTLAFTMCNADLQLGIKLEGGRLSFNTWAHVMVTMCAGDVIMYVNGAGVAAGSFSGSRLDSLGAGLTLGSYTYGTVTETFSGHVHDFRVWAEPAGVGEFIPELSKAPAAPPTEEGLLVRLFAAAIGEDPAVVNTGSLAGEANGAVFGGVVWDATVAVPVPVTSGSPWGVKLTVVPVYPPTGLDAIPSVAEAFAEFARPYNAGDMRHDVALVRWVNDAAVKRNHGVNALLSCKWSDLAPTETDLMKLPLVKELVQSPTPGVADARFTLVQILNGFLKDVLSLIDLTMLDKPWSIASLLSRCRGLIFTLLKDPIWAAALEATQGQGSEFELRLSRSRAMKFASQGKVDNEGRFMMFSQAFRQIHPMDPTTLRRSNKLYKCTFMGERSHDAGGPYRESWSAYCNELQSAALPMLHRTQNGLNTIGENREDWILNPGSATDTQMEMFAFLGKLFGVVSH
jgi:hypothetical protein